MQKPHPETPIVNSPKLARMGGRILNRSKRLLRFGQNNSGEYGKSLVVVEITKLSVTEYQENKVGEVEMIGFNGPHTLGVDAAEENLLIDYYSNEFSLFAGVRRINAKFSRK